MDDICGGNEIKPNRASVPDGIFLLHTNKPSALFNNSFSINRPMSNLSHAA